MHVSAPEVTWASPNDMNNTKTHQQMIIGYQATWVYPYSSFAG